MSAVLPFPIPAAAPREDAPPADVVSGAPASPGTANRDGVASFKQPGLM